jgi:hypothetical protein
MLHTRALFKVQRLILGCWAGKIIPGFANCSLKKGLRRGGLVLGGGIAHKWKMWFIRLASNLFFRCLFLVMLTNQ